MEQSDRPSQVMHAHGGIHIAVTPGKQKITLKWAKKRANGMSNIGTAVGKGEDRDPEEEEPGPYSARSHKSKIMSIHTSTLRMRCDSSSELSVCDRKADVPLRRQPCNVVPKVTHACTDAQLLHTCHSTIA
uniref:Uncharacterized protein n=1 Tax=Eutreptiella gymnastica TaxID=73025 RepID=A0A7S4G551_9EUGL|mmetsp:Transcript_84582/g.141382  ORF Transcript_84582/g.141382 Transcript_84582/m.141382 type:complete len:131 (+) Transcript_84582:246-638(+)